MGDGPEVELLPNLKLPTWDAAKWITGEDARSEAPEGSPHAVLAMYRDFDVDVRTALISIHEARVRREQAGRSLVGSQRYEQLTRQAAEFERIAHEDCERLQKIRERMRALGLCPAALPAELAFVADEEEGSA